MPIHCSQLFICASHLPVNTKRAKERHRNGEPSWSFVVIRQIFPYVFRCQESAHAP
jgi:hypothetical protein